MCDWLGVAIKRFVIGLSLTFVFPRSAPGARYAYDWLIFRCLRFGRFFKEIALVLNTNSINNLVFHKGRRDDMAIFY